MVKLDALHNEFPKSGKLSSMEFINSYFCFRSAKYRIHQPKYDQ